VENAHGTALLFDGIKIERLGANPEDAQLLELREFSVPEICRFFRMPPHKVQDLSRATFSNIEHQELSYVNDTLMPWLIRWEQEVDRKLLDGPGNQFLRHDTRDLLRGDAASRSAFYATMIQNGVMSVNEARDMEDLNPLPDGDGGNEHWRQLNMTRLNSQEDTQQ
jgi:HK97 family phage portal protein